jgi:hypothetical protein
MQYKINQTISVRYLAIDNEEGLTDLKLTPTNPSGVDQTPITFSEIGDGLYTAAYTPNALGWWQVRVSSVLKPKNIYSKSYFVGMEYTTYPPQEDGKLTSIDTKVGEVQATPTQYSLLGRLKDLWDKLVELFNPTTGTAKIKLWDGTETANVTTDNKLETITHGRGECSVVNSTDTPLGIGATFTGTWEEVLDYSQIVILVKTDQYSAIDGLMIEWSCDGINIDAEDKFTIKANAGKIFTFGAVGKYYKITYTNGAVAQSFLRLQTLLKQFNQKSSSHRITDTIVGEDDGELVKAVLTGKSDSSFINVKVTPLGRLEVENIPSAYNTCSISEVVDITIPATTDYWLLKLSNQSGIIDEIHIITDNNLFLFKINVDGINYFDESGSNLDAQYFLTSSTLVKNIGTNATGTQLHWTVPIYFNNSIQIGIYHPTLDTKKLKAYIILYKIRT